MKVLIKLSEVPLFWEAINRSMFPVQAYESVTIRQGEVVRRVEMTTVRSESVMRWVAMIARTYLR